MPAVVKCPNFHPVSDTNNYLYSLILIYYPFREESFLEGRTEVEAFEQLNSQFRKNTDNGCIHPELTTDIDQAILRLTEFNFDQMNASNLDTPLSMDYAGKEDMDYGDPGHEDLFPDQPTNILEEINQGISKLNNDQRKVFQKFNQIITGIKENSNPAPLRLIINGEGSCGKSYAINLLTKLIRFQFGKSSVLVAAPTGKSAFNINGLTLHKTFSLPVELDGIGRLNKLGAKKLQDLRHLYKNVKFILIDEMSLINYQTLRMIHLRLCELFESEEPFAGLNICLLGDLMQMKCPRGSYIFRKPPYLQAEVHLWRLFEFIELTINERQKNADVLLGICRRLRVGKLTREDIEMLQTRVLDPANPNYQDRIKQFADCIWSFPTIRLANKFNKSKSAELKLKLQQEGNQLYKISAHDTIAAPGTRFGRDCPQELIPKTENKTAGIPSSIELGIGSRVMLRRNIDVASGLVNGSVGTVTGFQWRIGRNQMNPGDLPTSISVKFDHMDSNTNVECKTAEFFGKRNTLISRRMLPFILSWGQNHHKLQGITVTKICVDLGKKTFAKGMAYVAISRVTTFEGLAFSDLDISKLWTTEKYTPCDTHALDELERLRQAFP